MHKTSYFLRFPLLCLISVTLFLISCKTGEAPVKTFVNPILDDGPDPYVYLHTDGYYYCMVTMHDKLKVWKSKDFTDLKDAESKVIWMAPDSGPNSTCIWAPEIHYISNNWYIYYSATDKFNECDQARNIFVLKNTSSDPLQGSWQDLGKIEAPYPGIDGHVFKYFGNYYFVYSPYIGNQSGIMIAKMKSPTEIYKPATILGLPIYDWEKTGNREIMEGPQFLDGPGNKVFLVYSAGACWDDNYGLGILSANKGADLLDARSWTRSSTQVFNQCPDSSVYGPGHNCFTYSPDSSQSWIVYHAKAESSNQCSGRSMRAQQFFWNKNGEPVFGNPVKIGTKLNSPLMAD